MAIGLGLQTGIETQKPHPDFKKWVNASSLPTEIKGDIISNEKAKKRGISNEERDLLDWLGFGVTRRQEEFNAREAQKARDFNQQEAQKARDFSERMSRNKYGYLMEDLEKAGINPAIAFASSGAIPSAPQGNQASGMGTSASQGAKQINLIGMINATANLIQQVTDDKKVHLMTAQRLANPYKKDEMLTKINNARQAGQKEATLIIKNLTQLIK